MDTPGVWGCSGLGPIDRGPFASMGCYYVTSLHTEMAQTLVRRKVPCMTLSHGGREEPGTLTVVKSWCSAL